MFSFTKPKKESWYIQLLQTMLNVSLIILGLVLSFFLFRELYFVVSDAFNGNTNVHDILEKVLVFFLYFVFVSMIVKYFSENYHFPLRYLIYIGITGTLRFIIVNHDDPVANLLFSVVILVLMIGYLMMTPRMKQINDEKDKME